MKRVLSLVLALSLVLGSIPAGFAATAGETLKGYGLVAGDTSGNLNEDKNITRGEMMVVLARLLGKFEEAKAYSIPSTSKDVAGHWAANYISFAEKEVWTSGMGNGIFAPNSEVTLQQVATFMLKALGYSVTDYAKVVEQATTLGLLKDVVAKDATAKVLRSDVFVSALNTINTPSKDSTVKLGEKLGVLKPVVVVEKVDLKSAVALNSKTVEVVLNTAIKTVDAKAFAVKDAAAAVINVTAATLAAYDATGKTVLLTLEKDTTAGTLYSVTAEAKTVNFGGKAVDAAKPTVTSVTSTDYNKVEVVFSEAIKLDTAKITLAKKYADKAALAVTATAYDGADTLVLTTGDQADATLYGVTVEGATDLAGNVIEKIDTLTFVGQAKSTANQTVVAAKALDYKTIYVEFSVNVDPTTVAAANFTLAEMYGAKAAVVIADAKAPTTAQTTKYDANNDTDAEKDAAVKKGVVLTLTGEVKDATLYKVTAAKVATLYGKALSSTEADTYKTFTGVSKPAADSLTYTANAVSNTQVELTFANDLDKATAETLANYTIAKAYGDKAALAVTKAELDENVVTLTVAAMTVDMYKVTSVNLKDIYGNAIKTSSDANIQSFAGKAVAAKISSVTATDVVAPSTGSVTVDFNVAFGEGALDVSSYSIDGGIGYPTKVTKVDADTVTLTIAKTGIGKVYALTVKNVKNSDGVAMDAAGIKTTFVGNDATAAAPRLEGAVAVNDQTIKLYFDTAVEDITGADDKANYTLTGATDTAPDAAIIDETNDKVLILYTATANGFENAAGSTVAIAAAGTDLDASYDEITMAESTTAPTALKVEGIVATSANTLTVYFNQTVRVLSATADDDKATEFAYVDFNGNGAYNAGVDGEIEATRSLNDEGTQWEVRLDVNAPANASYNLVIDETVAVGIISNVTNLVKTTSLYDAASTTSIAFAGTTSLTAYIKDVYVVATDARTLVVYFPESMDESSVETLGAADSVYDIVTDADATVIDSVYSDTNRTATLKLDADIDTASDTLSITNSIVKNAIGNKFVETSANADVDVVFAKSTATPVKVKISTVTTSGNTITIKFNQKFTTQTDITTTDNNVLDALKVTINGATVLADGQVTVTTKLGSVVVPNSAAPGAYVDTIVIVSGVALTLNGQGSVDFQGTVTEAITAITGQLHDADADAVVFAQQ